MIGSLSRWLKAIGYLLTSQMDASRRVLDQNPHVVRAKYDTIVRQKVQQIQVYKQAVAGLIGQQENKLSKLMTLSSEVANLERLKAGALAKARQSVERLKAAGREESAIKTDEDYRRCLAAYNDFSSTLKARQDQIAELERDVAGYGRTIGEHKVQLQQLLREVDALRGEAHEAVADVITAKQEREIADTLAGITHDGTAEELQRLRQMRQELRAEARISKELAGTDTRMQEVEFLEHARWQQGASEFDTLIGLSKDSTPSPRAVRETLVALPE